MIEIGVAHEFHHTYWIKHNNSAYTGRLLEWMVCEGKAETFSHIVYPDVQEPWDTAITAIQEKEIWDSIKNKLNSRDATLGRNIMLGKNGYPFACGYLLGRRLVTAALKQSPGTEAKYWTNFTPDYILKTSGYK